MTMIKTMTFFKAGFKPRKQAQKCVESTLFFSQQLLKMKTFL